MRQRHSRRGLGLAIGRGSRRDGGRRGEVDTLVVSGVDGGLRDFEKKTESSSIHARCYGTLATLLKPVELFANNAY
jgi:hypothetical protein